MSLASVPKPEAQSADDAAAEWLVRHDQGPLSPEEEARFYAWLSQSPRNEAAYDKACVAWEQFEGAAGDPAFASLRQEALRATPAPRRRWWIPAGAAIAASIAAAIVMIPETPVDIGNQPAHVAGTTSTVTSPSTAASATAFATRKGERRVIRLPDGSSVTLNTDTAIELAYSQTTRLIHLTRGQALFEVAKDKAWPFVVEAGGRQVTALGTIFEVRLDPGRVRVLLVEGRVVVDKAEGVASTVAVKPTILEPGQELLAELGATQRVTSTNVTSELLWKDGYIEFHDEPLGDAVAEINRYSEREIRVSDPRLADLRLSGVFKTGDPQRFSALVGELLPVSTRRSSDGDLEMVAADGRS